MRNEQVSDVSNDQRQSLEDLIEDIKPKIARLSNEEIRMTKK